MINVKNFVFFCKLNLIWNFKCFLRKKNGKERRKNNAISIPSIVIHLHSPFVACVSQHKTKKIKENEKESEKEFISHYRMFCT